MALELEQATRDRDRAAMELSQRVLFYAQRKAQYQEVVSSYDAWLKQNLSQINTSVADPLSGNNTELAVIGYEDGLISLAENLANTPKKRATMPRASRMPIRIKSLTEPAQFPARPSRRNII